MLTILTQFLGDEWNSGSGAHNNFGTNDMSSGNNRFGDNQGYQGDDAGAQEGNDICRICHESMSLSPAVV